MKCFPGGQFLQYVEPSSFSDSPESHVRHSMEPGWSENVPLPHLGRHSSTLLAPRFVLAVPGGHLLHLASESTPVAEEKVPLPHFWHTSAEGAPDELLQVPSPHGVHLVLL